MGDEGRVRPVARRLAGPDLDRPPRSDDAEHRVAAGPPWPAACLAAGGSARVVALRARLPDGCPIDMAAAVVGEGSRWRGIIRARQVPRNVLHVRAGFGHDRRQCQLAWLDVAVCGCSSARPWWMPWARMSRSEERRVGKECRSRWV